MPLGGSDEGGRAALEGAETLRQPVQRRVVEAAADAAGVAQGALLVVDAEQEGAEAAARSRRVGEAADDELLAAAALGLLPGARAAAGVRAVDALGHQALQPLRAGLLEDGVALPLDVVAVPHRVVQAVAAAPEQPLQPALAFGERQLAQVLAVVEQEVEGDVGDVVRAPFPECALQGAEVAHAALVEDHRFTVQPRPGGRQAGERLRDGREPVRPVQPVAREQLHALVHASRDAVTVVLDLVQPVAARGRLVRRRRQRQRYGGRDGRGRLRIPVTGRLGSLACRPPPPARLRAGGDLLHGAAGRDAVVVGPPRLRLTRPRLRVALLDEQPLVLLVAAGAASVDQDPAAHEALAGEPELELALLEARARVAHRLPTAGVPEHHRAAAVLALGDGALEVAVLDGVVLDVHGEPPDLGVEARPLGHGPADEDAVEFEPQVVVQAARGVLLDAEQAAGQALRAAGFGPGLGRTLGLGGLAEVALAPVRAQAGHGDQLALRRRWPLRPLASPTLFLRSSIMSTTSPPCRAGAPCLTGARPVLALASISWSRSSR